MMKMWLSRCTTRTCAWRQWTSRWAGPLGTRRTMLPSYFSITGCPSVHWWTQPCQWLIMFFTGSRDLRSSHSCPRGYRGICELLKSRTPHFLPDCYFSSRFIIISQVWPHNACHQDLLQKQRELTNVNSSDIPEVIPGCEMWSKIRDKCCQGSEGAGRSVCLWDSRRSAFNTSTNLVVP